ncbi:hypothetical protein [Pseudophaeobacter sp.]|uniref:hypothetical protein n=1 Tax=Pseudophaeobacter sp. TaxID=1971739 RepID=UPI00329800C0
MTKHLRGLCIAFCVLGVAACNTTTDQDTTSAPPQTEAVSPDMYKENGFQEFSYRASGKTYTLLVQRKAKGNFGLDRVHAHVSKGTPFTATVADDAEVQNMVRDAYRSLKLCPESLHPGIVNLGYGPLMVGDKPTWNVFLRCSEKLQENI